jgi:O-antigen biosynthesis protein WbqP
LAGLTAPRPLTRSFSLVIKRSFDIAAAIVGLTAGLPVMLVVALAIAATSPGPIIFWSTRVGRLGRLFRMPKFRTLRADVLLCPREQLSLGDADFTPIGRFLRRTGLDEMPQLFCVLAGEMSLIGPRPLLISDPATRERLNFPMALTVRPGISGLAQVNGRNAISPRRKARLDALYAHAVCLRVDAMLIVKTVIVVVSGRGFF